MALLVTLESAHALVSSWTGTGARVPSDGPIRINFNAGYGSRAGTLTLQQSPEGSSWATIWTRKIEPYLGELFFYDSLSSAQQYLRLVWAPTAGTGELTCEISGEWEALKGSAKVVYSDAAPNAGTWEVGDICWNDAFSDGEQVGWICTASGTPGTWGDIGTAGGIMATYSTMADLLAAGAPTGGVIYAITRGYRSVGDRGHGEYRWDAASTVAHDGGVTIRPTAVSSGSPGRWILLVRGCINVRQFGAYGNNFTDDYSYILAATTAASPAPGSGASGYTAYPLYFPAGIYRITSPIVVGASNILSLLGVKIYGDGAKASYIAWEGTDVDAVGATAANTTVLTLYHCPSAVVEDMGIRLHDTANFRCGIHFRVDDGKAAFYPEVRNVYIEGGKWGQVGGDWCWGGGVAVGGSIDSRASDNPSGAYAYGTYSRVEYNGVGSAFGFFGVNGENQTIRNCGGIHSVAVDAAYPKNYVYCFRQSGTTIDGVEIAVPEGDGAGTPTNHNFIFIKTYADFLPVPTVIKNCRLEHTWQLLSIESSAAGGGGTVPRATPVHLVVVESVATAIVHAADPGSSPCYMMDLGMPCHVSMKNVLWQPPMSTIRVTDFGNIGETYDYRTSILLDNCCINNTDAEANPASLLTLLVGDASASVQKLASIQTRGCSIPTGGAGEQADYLFWNAAKIPDVVAYRNAQNPDSTPTTEPIRVSDSLVRLQRLTTDEATPAGLTVAGTAGATYALAAGSNGMAGKITMTASATALAAGAITVTMPALGTNAPVIICSLENGTGTWAATALPVKVSGTSQTQFVLNWDNGAATTDGQVYAINYMVIGK
jgi:hypothetical protein